MLLVIQVSFSLSPSWEALSGSPAQLAVVVACLPLTATLVSTCNDLFFLPWLVSCLSFPKQKLQPSFVGPAVFCELVAVSCPFRYSVMPIGLVESSYCLLTEGNNSFYKMKVRCLWRWWGGWGDPMASTPHHRGLWSPHCGEDPSLQTSAIFPGSCHNPLQLLFSRLNTFSSVCNCFPL